MVGFLVFYIPLTLVCAKADDAPWKIYPADGRCGNQITDTGQGLGVPAGLLMGLGFGGLLVMLVYGLLRSFQCHDDVVTMDSSVLGGKEAAILQSENDIEFGLSGQHHPQVV